MFYLRSQIRKYKFLVLLIAALTVLKSLSAQNKDTVTRGGGGIFKGVIDVISRDTTPRPASEDVLNMLNNKYKPYDGMIIRKVTVIRVPFGTSLEDTTVQFKSRLTRVANSLHSPTKEKVIRNNLFFRENEIIHPYLFADNERFLRSLPFIRDADFIITPVNSSDTADILVKVKDLFNLGGDISVITPERTAVQLVNNNLAGTGNAVGIFGSYDDKRKKKFSFGGELVRRNIGGTFINQQIGMQSYYRSILRVPRQENIFYYNLTKPLLHRYDNLTYELDASYHSTKNRFNTDSLYNADFKYRYFQFEGWLGYNIHGKKYSSENETKKFRLLSGLRVVSQKFLSRPLTFKEQYNWQFADLTGVLTSFTLYRQNFFKTHYFYGFGINEDIPAGMVLTGTTGYTIKQDFSRPFIGLDFHNYGFDKKGNYSDFTFRSEGYFGETKIEDITLLASFNFITRLRQLSSQWKQRFFLTISASRQINTFLNEPLFIKSKFAMPEFGDGEDDIGGDARITAMAESVFFSPWNLAGFRVAPVMSYNLTAFSPNKKNLRLYSSIGSGFRVRNESLIFETIEFKFYYFPSGRANGGKFTVDMTTSFSLGKGVQFLQKPDFIQVN